MLQVAPVKTFSVDAAIAHLLDQADMLATAKENEMQLAYQRPLIKSEAISRLMSQPDPQKEGKLYSATAAERLVETDEAVRLHLQDERFAAAETIRRQGMYEAARFICRYVTAGAEVGAGA